jgi:hypothetical protein
MSVDRRCKTTSEAGEGFRERSFGAREPVPKKNIEF